ncbi:MAG TPA: DUF5916 domain-containing protein [Vicinamibacterales bacterium]|nr:DUF5916 domain-containing protein [Vicinamibacterales bacterium]
MPHSQTAIWPRLCALLAAVALVAAAAPARAQSASSSTRGETYAIPRATGPIVIDGNLSDAAWETALRIDRWYEINPGDNIEPPVKNVGYLTYDEHYIYAAFDFADPNPKAILAPFGDHDNLQNNDDFGGLFLDPRNEGHTAYEFQVTAHNIQFDAVLDDNGGGENASPDFFWDSAARINDHGWTLEIRIPFSSLRYRAQDPQTWGVMLWRNYARDFRHQFASAKQPRGSQCFICRENAITGLTGLPAGGHLVAAPYLSASDAAASLGDVGTPLVTAPWTRKVGADLKYTPNADNTLDGTVRPDFSQIESDTAQISTNQRFALFFPEKRPFFLEGVELLSTPIQAVYTRTITAPDWGGRATGKLGGVNYTALVAEDAGGGSVVVPGANSSSLADQDFRSTVFVGRARKDLGLSFLSVLATDRESGASGHNRVVGPDFQWRAHGTETVVGQVLLSDTLSPNRPDINESWTGQSLRSGAAQVQWNHNTTHYDAQVTYKDFGSGFRVDNGFVPQVGYRETYAETGWTFRPKGFVSRLRTFVNADRQTERENGAPIEYYVGPVVGMDTRWSGFLQFRYSVDRTRAGSALLPRNQFGWYQRLSPSRFIQFGTDGYVGQDVDFENARRGRGAVFDVNATINATDHLALDLLANTQWLHVDDATGLSQPLFTAHVARVKGTYTFTARTFVRVIGQYVSTVRDPQLYLAATDPRDGHFAGTALFAYKINWQSVMFVGYGDDRDLTVERHLVPTGHQVFVKLSYAVQR